MTLMKTVTALLALTTLTACDNVGSHDFSRERADGTYRAAMSDYQAGRLSQALEGFKKACAANPANASARFQLACLLQDSVKDYAGAFCAYREYLLQCPDSDKAKLAADRLATCEREMARSLSEKYRSGNEQDVVRQLQEAKAARTKAESELEKARVSLEAANRQLVALREENERLKNFMRDEAEADSSVSRRDEVAAARALVSQDEPAAPVTSGDVSAAKSMIEKDSSEPAPILVQDSGAKARRASQQEAEARDNARKSAVAAAREARPDTYVVQDGDTLYKIAVKFYGRASVWQRIRAANRATISMDGRLRVGQKIKLPNIE